MLQIVLRIVINKTKMITKLTFNLYLMLLRLNPKLLAMNNIKSEKIFKRKKSMSFKD